MQPGRIARSLEILGRALRISLSVFLVLPMLAPKALAHKVNVFAVLE